MLYLKRVVNLILISGLLTATVQFLVVRPFFVLPRLERNIERIETHSFEVARAFLQKSPLDHTQPLTQLNGLDWWIIDSSLKVIAKGQQADIPTEIHLDQVPTSDSPTVLAKFESGKCIVSGRLEPGSDKILVIQERVAAEGLLNMRLVVIGGSILWFFLTILFSSVLLVYYLRTRSKEAGQVIQKLMTGDLRARFQIKPHDEAGRLMVQFNSMADEIQRLVEALRATERNRMELIQELGHDLRIPLMSIQTILETLEMKSESGAKVTVKESTELALRELSYLVKLLDDLFLINQMRAPNYSPDKIKLDLVGILSSEIRSVEANLKENKIFKLEVAKDSEFHLLGDEKMLRRMFRNILLNSLRFARKEIRVSILIDGEYGCLISVLDDGPGIKPEMIPQFGKRSFARDFNSVSHQRVSTGLGSVIAATIAKIHDGHLDIKNQMTDSGECCGALVTIRLPRN